MSLPRQRSRPWRDGFTLLEILIAVSILGTSIVVVMGNINHAVRMYRVARETIVATSIAQMRMGALTGSKDPIRTQSDSGVDKENSRFSYQVTVVDAAPPGFEKGDVRGLYRAEVLVRWDDEVAREVRLVQYISDEAGSR